jgi:putative ABC transport system substrate-binding protein
MIKRVYLIAVIAAFLLTIFLMSAGFADAKVPVSGKKKIAIFTLLPHPSLDEAQAAFVLEMQKLGYVEGTNTTYIQKDMHGQVSTASGIANELSAQNPDIIITLTTPPTQAVAKTARCPVVFMSVVDPIGIGIVKSLKGEERVTGVRFDWAYDSQFQLIKEILPKARRVGVIHNPGDAASKYNVARMKEIAGKYNFEIIDGIVNNTNEVYPVTQNIAKRVDVIFSSDNTAISAAPAVIKAGIENKVPVFSGEKGFVEKGAVGAVSVNFKEMGIEAAKLADRILRGEKNIPITAVRAKDLYLNTKAAEMMGVKIPQKTLKRARKVFNSF